MTYKSRTVGSKASLLDSWLTSEISKLSSDLTEVEYTIIFLNFSEIAKNF